MKITAVQNRILNLTKNVKSQLFLTAAALLFLFKLFFKPGDVLMLQVINEILVVTLVSFFILYLLDLFGKRTINPVSMVMNVGILNAFLFFMITFSGTILTSLFGNLSLEGNRSGLVYYLVSFFYLFLLLISFAYFFLTFKEFYFFKQKKNVSTYFNTMIVFILLASSTAMFGEKRGLEFISVTFFLISITLIVINSVKISWIAFIVKKEKIYVLFLSVVIAILFIVNIVNTSDGNSYSLVLKHFSPSLAKFFELLMIYGIIYYSVLFFTTLFHLSTAEVYDRKAQEVTSLQYFSKLITQVLDFNELAETVTEIATKVCNAHGSWIVWKTGSELKNIATKNIGFVDVNLMTDYLNDMFLNKKDDKTEIFTLEKFNRRSELSEDYFVIAVTPLKAHNEIKGFLLTVKKSDFIFDDEDKNALETFGDYASVSIENSRLLEESIEKERLEKELDVAREIQRKILPAAEPQYKNLNIASLFIPAFEVGGDYYDFFEIDDDKLGFVIADVSGKGISAAFIMAEIKGIFESLSRTSQSPREIFIKANVILRRALERKTFVSAAYGIIDIQKEVLTFSRAGHCPLLLIRGDEVEVLKPTGIGLGLTNSKEFEDALEEDSIILKENDIIILYTDGITEAKNKEMEDFGETQFERILIENRHEDAGIISKKVIREITLFSRNNQQHDDITLVIIKWKQKLLNNGGTEWQNLAPQLKTKVM